MGKPTAKDKAHFQKVASLGCIICGGLAEIHHSRDGLGMGQRDHSQVYPLCPYHHRHAKDSRHGSPASFAENYGTDAYFAAKAMILLDGQ